jgi:hypothetical protein
MLRDSLVISDRNGPNWTIGPIGKQGTRNSSSSLVAKLASRVGKPYSD